MRVTTLFTKPAARQPMIAVNELRGVAGQGLAGDANAHAASPRQVLLVGADDLRALSVGGEQLRANLVLDGDVTSLGSGALLAAGALLLRVTIACEPCARLDRVRPGLFRSIGARRGVLARVLEGGCVRVGDAVRVRDERMPALHADWKRRVAEIAAAVPAGESISFGRLALVAGVDRAYIRAMPSVLRALHGGNVGRVTTGDAASLPAWDAQPYFADR